MCHLSLFSAARVEFVFVFHIEPGVIVQEYEISTRTCFACLEDYIRQWDGQEIHFYGTCRYIMAKLDGVFEILTELENCDEYKSCHKVSIKSKRCYDSKPLYCQSQQLSSALSSACDFRSHFCKQCGPRSDCSSRSSLIRVMTVCMYAKIGLKSLQEYSADDINRQHFQMQVFFAL